MNKNILIDNIERYAALIGKKPTPACVAAGVGKDFLSDIRRGRSPSVDKVAKLAAFLKCSTSDLIGDAQQKQPSELCYAWELLNEEGHVRLVEYATDLVASGRYIKTASDLGEDVG